MITLVAIRRWKGSFVTTAVMSAPVEVTEEQLKVWDTIASWDLSRELLYMKNRLGYNSRGHLSRMEIEYKRFMFLICTYRDREVPMGQQLDDMWHVAVLHTRNYTAFGDAVGGYIHHNPTVSDEENTALWPAYLGNTLALYEKHFGVPSEEFWDRKDPKTPCCTH